MSHLKANGPKQSSAKSSGARNAGSFRVLVTEPHSLMRAGLRTLLESLPEVTVVGEVAHGRMLVSTVQLRRPQIVLFGVGMAGSNWLTPIARIIKEFPEVKIVMLSTQHAEDYVVHMLRAGVSGILLGDATPRELREAFRVVVAGGTYLCRAVDRQAVKNRFKRAKGQAAQRPQLTLRQRQILELIAEGRTTKEIAYSLKLSTKTVETHRAHMMERLKIYNIPGLVRYAMRMGMATLDS